MVEVLDNVEYRKYLQCRVRTRGTYGTNRRYFCVEFLQESATTTQKRAANIYVSADNYTESCAREDSRALRREKKSVTVKFLSQKVTRRCRNLVAALPRR